MKSSTKRKSEEFEFADHSPEYSEQASLVIEKLKGEGIFPYGSAENRDFEKRMELALLRSYRQALRVDPSQFEFGKLSKEGPIAEETEKLMASHYDERAEFFCNFLDQSFMAYSMAYYGSEPDVIAASKSSLEEAQTNKFELFCKRAQLKGNEKVFNLGCGFGSLEKFLLAKYPEMTITGITPSAVQVKYLKEQMNNPDSVLSSGRFELLEGNFASVSSESLGEECYDAVFSVGVMEHIKNVKLTLERMEKMLKPGGVSFHHLIASYHAIPRFLDSGKTKIDKYFPGGRVWPVAELESHDEHLELEKSWYINGRNYWRTLDEWHKRFWQNIDNIVGPEFGADSVKHWNDYFCLCKIVFSPMNGEMVGNAHYLYRKTA